MIPKKIHYCWFGGNPLPKSAKKCIKSWKKHCRDYEIIEWNENNFDISSCPLYVRQAYEHKKWAFVTDYVRLKVIYDNGGIYLDTDVELIKNLDPLLEYHAYFGFEDVVHINTGHGFGAEKECKLLAEIMDDYSDIPFVKDDGEYDLTPCPVRNTEIFIKHGLQLNGECQNLSDNIQVFSPIYFCPKDFYSGIVNLTADTYSIHHFDSSWYPKDQNHGKKQYWKEVKKEQRRHIPNRILKKLFGDERYEKFKKIFKR